MIQSREKTPSNTPAIRSPIFSYVINNISTAFCSDTFYFNVFIMEKLYTLILFKFKREIKVINEVL